MEKLTKNNILKNYCPLSLVLKVESAQNRM